MRTLRSMPLPFTLLIAIPAAAQAPSPETPAAPAPPAPATPTVPAPAYPAVSNEAVSNEAAVAAGDPNADGDPTLDSGLNAVAAERRSGFTAGLRLGVGIPLGKAGRDAVAGLQRDLKDLTEWRAPIWIDVGYSLTGATTLGAYAQVGTGGTGDYCVAGADCDWSDIRIGAEAEWRFAPGAPVDPWLGIGLGYEWLSYRVLVSAEVPNDMGSTETVLGRATERLGGPELTLQGGLDFQVEDALRIGPYASATLSQYMTASYTCEPAGDLCPGDGSLDGAAFHSWIGVGVRGAYTP